MQTLTYMKHGGITHQDSQGNRGEIRGGGAQWMSAGRGIIHSEMPTQDSQGLHGFQLWVNLPASEKMSQPRYRDVPVDELVQWQGEGADAVLISGEWQLDGDNLQGPLAELAEHASIMDLELAPQVVFETLVPSEDNLVGYVYDGSVMSREREVLSRQMLITGEGDKLTLRAGGGGAGLLLLRGRPFGEPVAHYGPFVMNTIEEIERTMRDYQSGQFL